MKVKKKIINRSRKKNLMKRNRVKISVEKVRPLERIRHQKMVRLIAARMMIRMKSSLQEGLRRHH